MRDVYVTLDIDWAPDAAIDSTAALLEAAGCAATWFATHESPALERLRERDDLFELGIHPNFLPGSSHGSSPEEVLGTVLGIVPEARCVRAHAAAQSGPILKAMRSFTQLDLDCSVMLPGLTGVMAVAYGEGESTLWRIPNFWSDDYEAELASPNWHLDGRFEGEGVKVLIFHPIHIALNSPAPDAYTSLKESHSDLASCAPKELEAARHNGLGAGTMLERLAAELGRSGAGAKLSTLIPGGRR